MTGWHAWVDLWARRESPVSLGLVRMLVGLCLVVEFANLGRLGLVEPFMATQDAGGWTEHTGSVVALLGPWTTAVLLLGASVCLMLGAFTRTSAVVLVLVWARYAAAVPIASRAIDLLLRDVLCILALSGAGRWGSLDALWRTGSVWGDRTSIGAWARYLVIAQLVLVYFTAGLQKVDPSWWRDGTALFVILQDPAVARLDFAWLRGGAWRVTQVLTFATVLFQAGYPLMLLSIRRRAHWLWVAVGMAFHLGLAATMELGLFPWAMMALYPALIHPDHWPGPR